jgi:hypothetical protein
VQLPVWSDWNFQTELLVMIVDLRMRWWRKEVVVVDGRPDESIGPSALRPDETAVATKHGNITP